MNPQLIPDVAFEKRIASRVLDVLIRAGLILAMVTLCYKFFAPFLPMTVWALILAVTLYPFHQFIAGRLGGRQGLASTLLVIPHVNADSQVRHGVRLMKDAYGMMAS